jgi:hypothetical protein
VRRGRGVDSGRTGGDLGGLAARGERRRHAGVVWPFGAGAEAEVKERDGTGRVGGFVASKSSA